jgi:hypothetical protein
MAPTLVLIQQCTLCVVSRMVVIREYSLPRTCDERALDNMSTDLLYPRSPKREGDILFYLCPSVLPSVQDIFRRIFLSNC